MKKILALLLSVLMIFSLTALVGCDNNTTDDKKEEIKDKEVFIGSWDTTIEMADFLNEMFAGEGMEDLEFREFNISVTYTFDEDGTYEVEVDDDKTKKSFEKAQEDFAKAMKAMLQAIIDEFGANMTIDEYCEQIGTTFDELIEESFGDEAYKEMTTDIETKGNYKVKDGKLYTTSDTDEKIDEDEYETYEIISEKEIKLVKPFGEVAEEIKAMYPITLKKK